MTETSTSSRESDLAIIRQQVETERSRLEQELAHLKGEASGGDQAPFHEHPTDHAGEMEEHERQLAIRENLEQMYHQCQDALDRLARGDYGVCRSCGKEIDIERLKALPYATKCIPCKELRRD
ncbi:MAG: TraR/DksA C4-type zinc finger protein [Candidatus Dormibacteraeota bacterium]|jgi:RNA polymerase-binding protein DksA|nr:TraR/DksA C4-type zinc finger protein [Candidatus Dormibacteraeota bacterium]